ncbi:biotin transporter BioY [Roseivivax halodurans]|nr:biotin transporter BioY [Roseivivax halodurans]
MALARSPLALESRPLHWQIAAVFFGTVALAVASQISVPMVPVPVTMQTFAVMTLGALYGWKLGALTVLAWLGEAMLGAPVLSGGAGGPAPFVGPTAGYLAAFPICAALTGWLAERGWNGRRPLLALAAMGIGHVLCLTLGAAWLTVLFGFETAIATGVAPFLVGLALKSALGAVVLRQIAQMSGKRAE